VMRRLLILGIGALLVGATADAHHSFARYYDEGRQISLEGDIVSFELRSPHAWVYFTANDSTGVARRYGAEWSNPRRLEQQGIAATSIRPGEHVLVTGAPNRNATDYSIHLKSIHRPADGWRWPGETSTASRRR
jgi:uncharacterized protein DUF6152